MRLRLTACLLTATFLLGGCHRVHLPDYSEAEETQFRSDEVKDLTSPRGDLALVHSGLMESTASIGNGAENSVPLKNWNGSALVLSLHGEDIAVDKATGNALLDSKPLIPGQHIARPTGKAVDHQRWHQSAHPQGRQWRVAPGV